MQTRTRGKLVAHLATFGTVPALNPQQVLKHIFESNLDGRSGASFIANTLTTYHHEITAHTHGTCIAHS